MNTFEFYFNFGFDHILDMDAKDHIAFLVALCAIYQLGEWKKVLILVTAFTIGHSVTLGLAAMDLLQVNKALIELLIPVTILMTSLYNVLKKDIAEAKSLFGRHLNINYAFALTFGFIHGMGFSNTLKSMLMPGEENQLVKQLLAFNIGVEVGQLIIVAVILFLAYIALNLLKIRHRAWNLFISGAAAGISVILILEQL